MIEEKVSFKEIEQFLEGRDPQKYIVAIESAYHINEVYLVINDPETGKKIETHNYKPFIWMKHSASEYMFQGNRNAIRNSLKKHNLKVTALKIDDKDGNIPSRMDEGFKYMITSNGSYTDILNFTSEAFSYMKKADDDKVNLYSQKIIPNTEDEVEIRSLFLALAPQEQFLVQTGKRLFKGMDDYNDVHRMQFDLETHGLTAATDPIFQIGIRDNRGFEEIIEIKSVTEAKILLEGREIDGQDMIKIDREKRDSERIAIDRFFEVIAEMRPDIITAYNSEYFDWPYLERRCERLGVDITDIAKTLNPKSKFRRKPSKLKVGSETLDFEQTIMWGYNIIDISHTVRKTMAINSSIKSWSLKYITKFSSVAKANRVYVDGDKIYKTWADTRDYWFNDENGSWGLLENSEYINELPEPLTLVKGDYIVRRYLSDDLWETEQVDGIYNQAAFLVGKLLPTSYTRSSTMGTAGQWKLIMAAWSYEKGLGLPATTKKREFTGGLSRLLEVGYAKDVDKFDYAALYPKSQLTWNIFPDLDISGVMEGLLTYIVDTRDEFKFKAGKHKDRAKELVKNLEEQRDTLDEATIAKVERAIIKEKKLASDYDKKQLPLKILANSFFGALGAPYLFNWGDTDCAEETTCRGRQALRLMVKFFKSKGFRPLVGDTDGFNFARPESINTYTYTATGEHWKTEGQGGKTLIGVDAILAEFNETFMEGRMGLDLDDVCESTINFARKNYANSIGGKVKLVGNSVKSNKMPIYIEEFLDNGIKMLLAGDGYSFINYYYDYIEKIYNYQIPLVKIASKGKVKKTISAYKKHVAGKNKAGNANPRQAHMELLIADNIQNVSLGDVIYYVNTGDSKSTGDIKSISDKESGEKSIQLNCKLIPRDQIESNPELTTDEYNVGKYIDAFNKRIHPLLVCFSPDIRERLVEIKVGKNKGTFKTVDNIPINVIKVKDKETKKTHIELEKRREFTEKECELVAGYPYEKGDQDSYDELMTMEDKEFRFWTSVNKLPNYMVQDEWDVLVEDYHERMVKERLDGIKAEKDRLDAIFQILELKDLKDISTYGLLPKMVEIMVDVVTGDDGVIYLSSKRWDEILCEFNDMWKYEDLANERAIYYNTVGNHNDDDKYEQWLDYCSSETFFHGDTGTTETEEVVEKTHSEIMTSGVDAMNAITQYHRNVKKCEEDEDEDSEFNF
jgi:DNA polymerase elongation subunit (family B)